MNSIELAKILLKDYEKRGQPLPVYINGEEEFERCLEGILHMDSELSPLSRCCGAEIHFGKCAHCGEESEYAIKYPERILLMGK